MKKSVAPKSQTHFLFRLLPVGDELFLGNLKVFTNHDRIFSDHFIELWKDLSLRLTVKEVSKVVSCSVSLMLTLTWGIDISSQKSAPEIRGWIWKTAIAHYGSGVGISCKTWLLYLWPALWCLGYRALLDMPNYWSDSWERYNLKGVCWCVNGDNGS